MCAARSTRACARGIAQTMSAKPAAGTTSRRTARLLALENFFIAGRLGERHHLVVVVIVRRGCRRRSRRRAIGEMPHENPHDVVYALLRHRTQVRPEVAAAVIVAG